MEIIIYQVHVRSFHYNLHANLIQNCSSPAVGSEDVPDHKYIASQSAIKLMEKAYGLAPLT